MRNAVLESLQGSLSFDHACRVTSEDNLKIYETTKEDYGTILTEFIVDPNAPIEIRQLSSVLLKQYVECHWSQLQEEKFKLPEVTEQAKRIIREALPHGLKDDSSKVRSSVAYAMANIAAFDWPEKWPELFSLLIEALHSNNKNVIHGAMRVFAEFAGDLSDLQIPQVAPQLFPEMMQIFVHPEIYGVRTSARAANIFSTICAMLGLMKEFDKKVEKDHVLPYLPTFLTGCATLLQVPDGETSDCGLKMEILKSLEVLVKNFPKTLVTHISSILPPVWLIFTQSVDYYIKTTVNCIDLSEDAVDEEGEILSFENLVFSIFEFISALVETPKFKRTVEQYLEDILFFTVVYMQITEEQIHLWSSDPNQFVEDEDEETLSFSVRISAQYLILSLAEKFSKSTDKLLTAINRVTLKGNEAKEQGDPNWWKYYEVCLLTLGYVQPQIIERIEENTAVLKHIVEIMELGRTSEASPYIVGQSLWCCSRYASVLDDAVMMVFLESTIAALQRSPSAVLSVYAVKALFGFCDYLKDTEKVGLLQPQHLQAMVTGLISLATKYTDSVLAITLDTLVIVVKVNEEFTSKCVRETNLVPLVNALFLKHGSDHHLCPLIQDMIGALVSIPDAYQIVLEKTLPTILSILEAPEDQISPVVIPPTIDILEEIIRKSPKPLNQIFMKRAFPSIIEKTLKSDDEAIVQNGGECIRAFISCAIDQVIEWNDGSGQNGLTYVVKVVMRLLDPRSTETNAMFVGKLINSLVIKAGAHLGESMDQILRSVLSKLQQVKMFSVTQSLLMVFIQLIRHQMALTLEFLSTVPGPTGTSALDYVLTEWCNKQSSFFGSYETKASCDAMCKLLSHAVTNADSRFDEIKVHGDEVRSAAGGIHTRSKTKTAAKEYTTVPVGIKLFKLLVSELHHQVEMAEREDEETDEEGDDWEDVDDEEKPAAKDLNVQQIIESLFAPAGDFMGFDDDDEDDDDPDIQDDPINTTDMKLFLTQFMKEFSQYPHFNTFVEALNPTEKQCLSKVASA